MTFSLLVDGSNFLRRVHSVSENQSEGVASKLLASLVASFSAKIPYRTCVVFDPGGKTWRHEILPCYKEKRKPKIPEYLAELERAKVLLSADPKVEVVASPGFEADDVLATLCAQEVGVGRKVVVVSNDGDLRQLLRKGVVTIISNAVRENGEWGFTYLTYDACVEKTGIKPEQYADFQAITGDTSDGFKGIPGLGEKTAKELIQKFGSVEEAVRKADQSGLGPAKMEALRNFDWKAWCRFAALREDAEIVTAALDPNFLKVPTLAKEPF